MVTAQGFHDISRELITGNADGLIADNTCQRDHSDDMAVLNSDGSVVGRVVNVSPNFSSVMSLLHVQSMVSAALKNTGEAGRVSWDGKDPRFVQLEGISKSVKVKVGDTVVTGRYSDIFPPEKMIGTVSEVTSDPATGFYLLKVKFFL